MIPGSRARAYLKAADPRVARSRRLLFPARRVLVACSLALAAFFIVLATLSIDQTAASRTSARQLAFGYPVHFVVSDVSAYSPPAYPQTYRLNPWEDPSDIQTERLLLDWVLATLALWMPLWFFRRARATSARTSFSPR